MKQLIVGDPIKHETVIETLNRMYQEKGLDWIKENRSMQVPGLKILKD